MGASGSHRGAAFANLLDVLADLMRGATHDRHSIAQRCGVKESAADRKLRLLAEKVPGVRLARSGRVLSVSYEQEDRNPPRFPIVVSACLAACLGSAFRGSVHEQNMRDARQFLLERLGRDFPDLDRKFVFVSRGGEQAFPDLSGDLDDVIDALLNNHEISFDYQHFDGRRERVHSQPLSLALHEHQFYVLARRARRQSAPYPFRFARMRNVSVHGAFEYPCKSTYDPEQLLRDSLGIFVTPDHPVENVEVLLSDKWRTYVECHRWHPSQHAAPQANGVLIRLHVRLCPELERWILAFGEEAEVLAPLRLRETIARRLAAAAAGYSPAPKPSVARSKPSRPTPPGITKPRLASAQQRATQKRSVGKKTVHT